MALEKIFPRLNSFLPGGIYYNFVKKDFKKLHLRAGDWKEEFLTNPTHIKSSKQIGYMYEGFRTFVTLSFGLTSWDIGNAAIAYGATTYIIDRISNAGIILGN